MVASLENYFTAFGSVFPGFIDFFRFLARLFENLLLSFGQAGFVVGLKK
jgi:hypothetical protein